MALVDDNDDARLVLGEVLASWGHQVSQAAAGASGVDLIVSGRPDAAFIDIGLPDIDGFEVARKINMALGVASPLLVALSGFGRLEDRERALSSGFQIYLAKPVEVTELISVVARAARRDF